MALDAASELLVEQGPQAVTLKAVAARIGQTHSNILHHFGSAAALHQELTLHLAKQLQKRLDAALEKRRAGIGTVRDTVDALFDAFAGGGAQLCAWLLITGNMNFFARFTDLFTGIVDGGAPDGKSTTERRSVAFRLALLALGDALMGDSLAEVLAVPRGDAREHAEMLFGTLVAGEGLV